MTGPMTSPPGDPLDDRLETLFAAAADELPPSEQLLATVMAKLAARERERSRVLRGALLLGMLLALGSVWLLAPSWQALAASLGAWLGSARDLAGGVDLLGSSAVVAVAPLVLLLLWPLLAESRAS